MVKKAKHPLISTLLFIIYSCISYLSSQSAVRVFDAREVEELCEEYAQYMNRLLNGPHGGLDLASLCIIPNSNCWIIYIDALVLDFGGNLLDAILLATRGALFNTRISKCTIEQVEGKYEFDVADEETDVLAGWREVPVCVTLNKVKQEGGKVRECCISEETLLTPITNHKFLFARLALDL